MGRPKIDLTGQRYGRLTVLKEDKTTLKKARKWLCICDCGKKVSIFHSSLQAGATKSCGCFRKEYQAKKQYKHGGCVNNTSTRLYKIWDGIKQRIDNPKTTGYQYYGGRGITLCNEWRDFIAFKTWATASGYKNNLSIDRINNNLGYYPENCRWATNITQGRNQSKSIKNTSGFIGVSFHKDQKKWIASIRINGKRVHLGYFSSALKAAIQRDSYIQQNALQHYTMNGVLNE